MSVENNNEWNPKIIVIACNWCTYAAADLAGLNHYEYPADIRIIRVPCSGRMDPLFMLRAFNRGADGVLLSGCHPGDCHYGTGNYYNRRRQMMMKRLMQFVGLEPERYQTSWISGAEGSKFAETMHKLVEDVTALGPNRKLRDER
ncbi:MAG TPA: hydrogenase iron-sulfur subunit [Syntrophomonadaceae bacterium]|nr:hydrogenase iron-sulfur subunit [Syntrophomonadaceae bacterium]